MKRIFLPLMLVGMVSACSGNATGTAAPAATPTPDAMEAKIDALSPALQVTTLFRAIQDGGYTCQKIVQFAKHTPPGGKPTWIAECDDHGQYVIELQQGGVFWVSGVPQKKHL